MKKELAVHLSLLFSLVVFVSLVKGWFSLSYWPFWVGALIGNFLVDIDHFIYVYFLRPHEVTSRRVDYMVGKRKLGGTLDLLAETRGEREDLIFHTILFQIIFLILTFLVMTSSGSLLGRGLVLALSLHLLVDQAVDLLEVGNLNAWTNNLPVFLKEDKHKIYFVVVLFVVLFFAFLL